MLTSFFGERLLLLGGTLIDFFTGMLTSFFGERLLLLGGTLIDCFTGMLTSFWVNDDYY